VDFDESEKEITFQGKYLTMKQYYFGFQGDFIDIVVIERRSKQRSMLNKLPKTKPFWK